MNAVLDIPDVTDQHAFNLERWREICDDAQWWNFDGRIESDQHGNVIMTPPAGFGHGESQFAIAKKIDGLLPGGHVLTECPISTDEGVRVADVAWISKERRQKALQDNILLIAPEICVEVISPRNRRKEMEEKRALYFAAGAGEVWMCDLQGRMTFFLAEAPEEAAANSKLCPSFPPQIL